MTGGLLVSEHIVVRQVTSSGKVVVRDRVLTGDPYNSSVDPDSLYLKPDPEHLRPLVRNAIMMISGMGPVPETIPDPENPEGPEIPNPVWVQIDAAAQSAAQSMPMFMIPGIFNSVPTSVPDLSLARVPNTDKKATLNLDALLLGFIAALTVANTTIHGEIRPVLDTKASKQELDDLKSTLFGGTPAAWLDTFTEIGLAIMEGQDATAAVLAQVATLQEALNNKLDSNSLRIPPPPEGEPNGVLGIVNGVYDPLTWAEVALQLPSSGGGGVSIPYHVGSWYGPPLGRGATQSLGVGQARPIPFRVTKAIQIDRIGTQVTTAASGSQFYLYVLADNGTGWPSNVIARTDLLSGGATGFVEGPIVDGPITLAPGVYWTTPHVTVGPNPTFAAAVERAPEMPTVTPSGSSGIPSNNNNCFPASALGTAPLTAYLPDPGAGRTGQTVGILTVVRVSALA